MGFINLIVQNEAKVTVDKNRIVLENDINKESFPLEDVNSILFENLRTNISTYTISRFAEYGIIVYFCNDKHLPNAYLLPFNSHYNQLKIYNIQANVKLPFKKQLWKSIVERKIQNQDRCLQLCGKSSVLLDYSKNVLSHDKTNMEAVAASKYFRTLFDKNFSRETDNNINSALNYGYAILRGCVARSIVSHGLVPFLALKHHNQFNTFNLADDLLEVFRPFVDLLVYQNRDLKFSTEFKRLIGQLLSYDCKVGRSYYSLSYAIELYVQSYVDSISSGENKLKFPEIIELRLHEYE